MRRLRGLQRAGELPGTQVEHFLSKPSDFRRFSFWELRCVTCHIDKFRFSNILISMTQSNDVLFYVGKTTDEKNAGRL